MSGFHPYPKSKQLGGFKVKSKKPIEQGKKTKAWNDERAKLKRYFYSVGIRECEANLEGCLHDNMLGFAHRTKRRFLGKEDLDKVILSCQPCHDILERLPRVEMEKFIDNIISKRFLS